MGYKSPISRAYNINWQFYDKLWLYLLAYRSQMQAVLSFSDITMTAWSVLENNMFSGRIICKYAAFLYLKNCCNIWYPFEIQIARNLARWFFVYFICQSVCSVRDINIRYLVLFFYSAWQGTWHKLSRVIVWVTRVFIFYKLMRYNISMA